jgi:hypothetical protein
MLSRYGVKEKFREPINEKGVFYLFSRYHEELGFEEMVEFIDGTPDLRAIKGGKEVGVELEYAASGAFFHYCAINQKEQSEIINSFPNGEWQKNGNYWKYIYSGETKMSFKEEPDGPCVVDPFRKVLLYKTARSVGIDIIVYWTEGTSFRFWDWDKEVEPFPLKIKLQEIGKI